MKKNPLVSVVIPVFNEERYLLSCLKSLKNQTYTHLEIIVVDDASTDNSLEIAQKFTDSVFKIHHSGPGFARNFGAEKSKGEILAFLDADMKYDSLYIENLIKPITQKNVIGTCGKEKIANSNNILSQCWSINSDYSIGQREPVDMPKTISVFRAVQKKFFETVSGFSSQEGYTDDISLSQKLGEKACVVENAVAYHYNPETLVEVFYSARWIGRDRKLFKPSVHNFLRFSILNSIRNSIKKRGSGVPKQFLFFKIVYDFGMLCGIFLSFGKSTK